MMNEDMSEYLKSIAENVSNEQKLMISNVLDILNYRNQISANEVPSL